MSDIQIIDGQTLGLNFDETPDTVQPIKAGIWKFRIHKPEKGFIQENKNKDGHNLVIDCECISDAAGEDKGRKKTRWISTKMATELKRLCLSAGVNTAGKTQLPVSELENKVFVASLVPSVFKDRGGVDRQSTDWGMTFIPADPDFASAA